MTPADDSRARASRVQVMVFDVDGVLSDGTLYYTDAGSEIKAFHSLDGLGINLLKKAGIAVAIITGRDTPCVTARMRHLGIDLVFQGVKDKLATLRQMLDQLGLPLEAAGFMGDDIIDIRAMAACGFSATPADGQACVRPFARLITQRGGGRGAAREVCDFILEAQGKLDGILAPYLPDDAR